VPELVAALVMGVGVILQAAVVLDVADSTKITHLAGAAKAHMLGFRLAKQLCECELLLVAHVLIGKTQ